MTADVNARGAARLWVTGASDGIGYALAAAALRAGMRVAASARRAEKLHLLRAAAAADGQLLTLPFDVRDAAAAHAAAAEIRAAWGGADWAVANAGDCAYLSPNKEWNNDIIRRMIEVNYYGCCNTAAAALPLLQQAQGKDGADGKDAGGRGLFAAVTSAALAAPLPRGCAYGASKAAIAYFVESLRGHFPQVDFCLIEPGFVKTPLTDKNDFPMPALMPAERAAQIILRGLRRRRARIRFPRRLFAALHVIRFLPARLQQRLLVKMARHD